MIPQICSTAVLESAELERSIIVHHPYRLATIFARIDEKAQLYYINQDLPTFAFELQFLKGKQRCTGWFLNENLVTDYYLLIWPHAKTAKVSEIKKDDFTVLDALMISRHKIHSFLSRNGLNQDELLCTANSLREKG